MLHRQFRESRNHRAAETRFSPESGPGSNRWTVAGWFCRSHLQCRAKSVFQRRSKKGRFSMTAFEPHPISGQPIGLPVERTGAAPRPGPVTLKGHYGRLEKLRPDHWSDLWVVFAGHDHVWTYIPPDGPFVDSADFAAFIATRAAADDPYAYAIVDAQ